MASAKQKQIKVDKLRGQIGRLEHRVGKAEERIAAEQAEKQKLVDALETLKRRLEWQTDEPVDDNEADPE